MKILFLTTYNVTFFHEHYFTINVFKELKRQVGAYEDMGLELATISVEDCSDVSISDEWRYDVKYTTLHIPFSLPHAEIVDAIKMLFTHLAPDVIHSQMMECYDIEAAKSLGLPIVNTIHIGGIICPASGGSGFMLPDGSICDRAIGTHCERCLVHQLPVPMLAKAFRALTARSVREALRRKIEGKQILYLTPLLNIEWNICDYKRRIELLKYSHLIAANEKLTSLLAKNGVRERVHLIPHGVKARPHIHMPLLEGKVKFYYIGRTDRAKGVDLMIEAFKHIDSSKAELHIVGDPGGWGRKARKMWNAFHEQGNRDNIFIHGRLKNDEIDQLIANWHVMIHPARYHEIYGIAIAETLAIGRPVIATRCGGAEMQIVDGQNGWLIEQNNQQALTAVMQRIVDNPDLIQQAAKNCQLPHPIEGYVEKLIGVYSNVITQ